MEDTHASVVDSDGQVYMSGGQDSADISHQHQSRDIPGDQTVEGVTTNRLNQYRSEGSLEGIIVVYK